MGKGREGAEQRRAGKMEGIYFYLPSLQQGCPRPLRTKQKNNYSIQNKATTVKDFKAWCVFVCD